MLRLRPVGKKNQRSFRLIVSEKTQDVYGNYLENLGWYNPNPTPAQIKFNEERVKYWLGQGAQPSDTVNNLLIDVGLLTGEKIRLGNANRGKKEVSGDKAKPTAVTAAVKPGADQAKAEAKPVEQPKTEAKKPEAPKPTATKEIKVAKEEKPQAASNKPAAAKPAPEVKAVAKPEAEKKK